MELKQDGRAIATILSNVSHDLKNPLTSVAVNADMLHRHLKKSGQLNDRTQKYLDTIQRNVVRIKALIDDSLDVAKVQDQIRFQNLPSTGARADGH